MTPESGCDMRVHRIHMYVRYFVEGRINIYIELNKSFFGLIKVYVYMRILTK